MSFIGIDLGTTPSTVAVLGADGEPTTAALAFAFRDFVKHGGRIEVQAVHVHSQRRAKATMTRTLGVDPRRVRMNQRALESLSIA